VTDGQKRILGHVLRFLVAAGLVAYVVRGVALRDTVRAAPGEEARPVLGETPEGVVVGAPDGSEVVVPHAAFGPGGAVRLSGIGTILRRLGERWGWALAALGAMMLQTPLGAVRWQLLLAVQDIRITLLESLRLTYIGWFFNNWMPGATGGDFVKAYYIARQTHRKTEAVTVVVLDRVIGLVAMCMLGAAAIGASLGDSRVRVAQAAVGVFLGGAAVGGVVFYSRRLRQWVRAGRVLSRLPLWPILARADRALLLYRHHKAKVAAALVYSWAAQAASVLVMWFVATGLGSRAAWSHYFLTMPVIWIGWSLVPVPGGVGVAETLAQGLFTPAVLGGEAPLAASEAATLALAMMLAYRLVQMAAGLPGAVLYLARRTDVSPMHMRDEVESEAPDA